MYNLSHVKTERTYTPAQLQTLVKSCQLSSSVVPVRTTNSHIQIASSQFFRESSFTQSVKMFREKIGCVVPSTHRSVEAFHRLLYCQHLRLSSCSARRCIPSSTWSVRSQENHPYTFPTGKLSVSKSSLCRRQSIEVCFFGKPSLANSHHHVSRHYLELPSTTLFARTSIPARSFICLCSFDSMETTNSSRSWLCLLALSCQSDPLIISTVLRSPSRSSCYRRLHPVMICALVLFLGTHRVERTCCNSGVFSREL